MYRRIRQTSWPITLLILIGAASAAWPQAMNPSFSLPQIEIQNYKIEAVLMPDSHELSAAAAINFNVLEDTDIIAFELSENLMVQRVLDSEGIELEFSQYEIGPGFVSVRFDRLLEAGSNTTITIEYEGGFDRDRFSRIFTRDDTSAYIGMESTYLMYSAKWFPISQFLVNRATATLEVTVPLGMTVIGPGIQMPVVTKGINETFTWKAEVPILPGSLVAGQYFHRKIPIDDFTIECFAKENELESMQKNAKAVAKILAFYQKAFGPSAAGDQYRLVEVDEPLAVQPGMLGTIFVTRSELAQSSPPIRALARRVAYQWWQETVGIQDTGDLWLVDGMAFFSAARYIGESQGSEALKAEIDNLAILALKFEDKSSVRFGLELGYRTDQYESVVAGKGAWVLNMLRGLLGESEFEQLTQNYVREYAGKRGGTSAFKKLAEELYGEDLGWYIAEWIDTIGIPTLELDYVVYKTANGFHVSGAVKQERDLFRMPIEVAVVSRGKKEINTIELSGKTVAFDVSVYSMPEEVVLDPNNKLLRDSRELKTSVQLALGDDLKEDRDFVGAVRAYEAALKLSPNRSLAHFRLAEVFYEQFNLQSSANSFRDALNGDRDPEWIIVWSYIYLGKIYDILGQRQRAMAEYTKALNTKDDTNGAQAEAKKWLDTPFTRARTTMRTK